MSISVNWLTKVITVPKSFMTELSPTLYELDVNAFRIALKDIEDGGTGMVYPDTHRHNSPVTLAGVTYARTLEIINGYTVTFEDGQYAVRCIGANHNIGDVKNLNQVSLIIGNAAGLIVHTQSVGGIGTVQEVKDAVWGATNLSAYGVGSAGVTLKGLETSVAALPAAIRTELEPELDHIMTLQNGQGLDSTQATMLLEIYRLYGLDPTKPLIVTKTARTITGAGINQVISGDANTTTVTRV